MPRGECRFGPFRLDARDERLWRDADELVLRPKTFAVLAHLAEHPGELVSRNQLLEAVWPGTVVSDAVLTVCIGEIRLALADDAQAPTYVETLHRRGYRFIARLRPTSPPPRPATSTTAAQAARPTPLVGRETELARLDRALEAARGGARGVVFVTGEAGIGKSSLVNAFLERAGLGPTLWCARGQCIDHYGAGEAYLPVLDALGRLDHEFDGGVLRECLGRHAPTWLAQIPTLTTGPHELATLPEPSVDTGRRRMLRELAEALEALTADRPLILVLEDLHWSDYATVDLISWLARRQDRARLLLVGTYRPVDVIVRDHPMQTVKQELSRHGRCEELPLELLTVAEVEQHLAARASGPDATLHDLARTLHRQTDGHPLFLTTLVDALVRGGWLAERAGRWEARPGIEAAACEVPRSLQELVEQQFRQLGVEDQRLLEAVSAVGLAASAAAVAAGLAADVMTVEERCAALTRLSRFLHEDGVEEWPDGTVSGRYRFRHTLYRQVVYDRVPVGRRVQLHARIAERVEAAYGAHAAERAAELAIHFEQGHAHARALHHRRQAADNALRRHAYHEAIDHLHGALTLLARLPATPEHAREDLALHVALGQALSAIHGPAAAAVGEAYARAQVLCQQVEDVSAHLSVLQGLRRYHLGRAQLKQARDLGEEVVRVTERLGDAGQVRAAHAALGACLLYLGELSDARTHLLRGIGDGPRRRAATGTSLVDLEAGVASRSFGGIVLWLLGHPDQALGLTQEALASARSLGDPLIQATVSTHAAIVHQFRGEAEQTREHAEAAMSGASEGGFLLWAAHAAILRGWAVTVLGRADEGIAGIVRGLAAWRAHDQELGRPYLLALLAEAQGRAGQTAAGLDAVAEGLRIVETHRLRTYEAELYRLKGELVAAAGTARHEQAEACFRQAIEVARGRGARSLELRAALGLARLGRGRGRASWARAGLAEVYAGFTEGFDTGDLREARTLLGR